MRKTIVAALFLALLTPPSLAIAHLGEPTIKRLRFPSTRAEAPWFIIDNVGLLGLDAGWRWLCDEAISDVPGLEDLAPIDAEGRVWLAATRGGLIRTDDGGCTFTPIAEFAEQSVGHLSPDPTRPGHALVGTTTVAGMGNDVHLTTDGGETWRPAGLHIDGRVRSITRAEADPMIVYVLHSTGAARSEDGGQTFTPIALAPPTVEGDLPPSGTDISHLTTDPHDPMTLWSAFVRFPQSDLMRSHDGGETWEVVARFPDDPRSLVIDPTTGHLLLAMALEGLRRSTDAGETWDVLFLPEPDVWLDCLIRGPDGAIWACARRNAPYLVATTRDMGDSWTGQFAADYTEIDGTWGCPAETMTGQICEDACDRAREDCSGNITDAGPGDAAPPEADAGDVAPPDDDDCRAMPGAPAGGPGWWLCLVIGLAAARRSATG